MSSCSELLVWEEHDFKIYGLETIPIGKIQLTLSPVKTESQTAICLIKHSRVMGSRM